MSGNDWEARVRNLEEEARVAFVARDIARLDQIMSLEYFVNSPMNAVIPKPRVLELLSAGRIAHISYDGVIEHMSRHGDTAVVMGSETVVNVPGGESIHRRHTNVWRLENGEWKGIARHANVVGMPPDQTGAPR
jgi:ketosteroid isomerase-like protein